MHKEESKFLTIEFTKQQFSFLRDVCECKGESVSEFARQRILNHMNKDECLVHKTFSEIHIEAGLLPMMFADVDENGDALWIITDAHFRVIGKGTTQLEAALKAKEKALGN